MDRTRNIDDETTLTRGGLLRLLRMGAAFATGLFALMSVIITLISGWTASTLTTLMPLVVILDGIWFIALGVDAAITFDRIAARNRATDAANGTDHGIAEPGRLHRLGVTGMPIGLAAIAFASVLHWLIPDNGGLTVLALVIAVLGVLTAVASGLLAVVARIEMRRLDH